MAYQHAIETRLISETVNEGYKKTVEGDGQLRAVVAVPAESAGVEVLMGIETTSVKSLFIGSNQDVTVRLNAVDNDTGKLEIKANCPKVWDEDSDDAVPLAADVTKFFIANAGTTAATVRIDVIVDTTP